MGLESAVAFPHIIFILTPWSTALLEELIVAEVIK
jgi:hypothetical protein